MQKLITIEYRIGMDKKRMYIIWYYTSARRSDTKRKYIELRLAIEAYDFFKIFLC